MCVTICTYVGESQIFSKWKKLNIRRPFFIPGFIYRRRSIYFLSCFFFHFVFWVEFKSTATGDVGVGSIIYTRQRSVLKQMHGFSLCCSLGYRFHSGTFECLRQILYPSTVNKVAPAVKNCTHYILLLPSYSPTQLFYFISFFFFTNPTGPVGNQTVHVLSYFSTLK